MLVGDWKELVYRKLSNKTSTSLSLNKLYKTQKDLGGCPRGVMVKTMDFGIVVSEFVLHVRANTLGKGMNPLILPAMGEIEPLLFF